MPLPPLNALLSGDAPSASMLRYAHALADQIEASIAARYGIRPDEEHALHGRSFLAAQAGAALVMQTGWPARVEARLVRIDHTERGIEGLDCSPHAWIRVGSRLLIDPSASQLDRPRFGAAIPNAGHALVQALPVGAKPRARRLQWKADPLSLTYQRCPEVMRAMRGMPDCRPGRWRELLG